MIKASVWGAHRCCGHRVGDNQTAVVVGGGDSRLIRISARRRNTAHNPTPSCAQCRNVAARGWIRVLSRPSARRELRCRKLLNTAREAGAFRSVWAPPAKHRSTSNDRKFVRRVVATPGDNRKDADGGPSVAGSPPVRPGTNRTPASPTTPAAAGWERRGCGGWRDHSRVNYSETDGREPESLRGGGSPGPHEGGERGSARQRGPVTRRPGRPSCFAGPPGPTRTPPPSSGWLVGGGRDDAGGGGLELAAASITPVVTFAGLPEATGAEDAIGKHPLHQKCPL